MMKLLSPEQVAELDPSDLDKYKQWLQLQVALKSPLDLMCWLSPETTRTPHLEYLNEMIVAVIEYRLYKSGPGPVCQWYYRSKEDGPAKPALTYGKIPVKAEEWWGEHPETGETVLLQLGIAMPPRHGKSYLVSEHLPLWYWLRHPDDHIAFVTYSDDFAQQTWGVKIREKLLEHEDKLGMYLTNGERQSSAHMRFKNSKAEMFLVGTGGTLTGKGYQLGIIDDPFKDAAEALSLATRNGKGNWYESTFENRKTRLPDRGIPIIIMMFTRWHEDDLAGRYVYNEEGKVRDDWYMLKLPALAEEDDPIGREIGEALWPYVKNRKQLLKLQAERPTWFASQYQGSPSFGDQGIFPKWYHYRKVGELYMPDAEHEGDTERPVVIDECIRFATIDMAATKNTWSDWSVYAVWDFHRPTQKLFLAGFVRERVTADDHDEWLRRCYARWPNTKYVGIEEMTFGQALIQQTIRKGGLTVRPLKADKDKIARAIPYGQAAANHQIFIPSNHPELHLWLAEHSSFPVGTHDDMVDVGGYAWSEAVKMPAVTEEERYAIDTSMEAKFDRYVKKRERKGRVRHAGLRGSMGR